MLCEQMIGVKSGGFGLDNSVINSYPRRAAGTIMMNGAKCDKGCMIEQGRSAIVLMASVFSVQLAIMIGLEQASRGTYHR